MITVVFGSFYFVAISAKEFNEPRQHVDVPLVIVISVFVFILTVAAAASCKHLAEEKTP